MTEGRRTAIIFGGSAYNIRFSLKSQLENLIIPNNADVFVLTTRFCKRRITFEGYIPLPDENDEWVKKVEGTIVDEEPLRDDELQLIRDTFGDRLKVLQVVDEMPQYLDYIHTQRHFMMEAINEYIKVSHHLKLPAPYNGIFVNTSDVGTIRCIIDQYNHIKKCYELMEQYENEHGFRYDYVMRARIDFFVPEVINIEHYTLNHDQPYLYCMGSFRRDVMEWADEFCWFSQRSTAAKLFPQLHRMGFINNRKYQTLQYGTKYAPTGNDFMFDPECQFSILLHELGLKVINVRIYRSAGFTNGNDGFDYMNYRFQRASIDLDYEYQLVCSCETDINQHLPILREYAEKCDHVTEIGLRYGNSTVAFMAARPKRFITYDQQYNDKMDYLKLIAKDTGAPLEIRIENATPEDGISRLEETDLLFIDSNHNVETVTEELKQHPSKVRKYIIFHDVSTFWTHGQGYENINEGGLRFGIEPFLASHPEWKIIYRTDVNNGLMILERQNGN